MIGLAIGLCLFILGAWPAWSADDPDAGPSPGGGEKSVFETAEDEWIVSGTRLPRQAARQPFPSFRLDADRLERGPSSSVSDALRFVPGLHLVQEGAPGGRAALALRGLDPNHVVVLVDGVRVNDPTNSRGGSFDPTTLALVDLERVEIVRGPLSSIHGADALAGVVQIVTRGVEVDAPLRTRVRARAGRFHAAELAGQASAGVAGLAGLSLGTALSTSRDPSSDGGFDAASVHAKLRVPLPRAFELEAFGRFHSSSARAFPESSGGPELAVLRAHDDRATRELSGGVALARAFAQDSAHLRLQAAHAARREDVESPGVVPLTGPGPDGIPPSRSGDEYDRSELGLSGDLGLPAFGWPGFDEGLRLAAGTAVVWEDGEGDTALDLGGGFVAFPFFERRRTASVFGEIEQPVAGIVTISASVRFDSTPDEDDRTSPAVGWHAQLPGTPFSLYARYGQGFRRPSFFALGNPIVGNRGLPLERGRSVEAGVRYGRADGALAGQLGWFDLEVENLHDFDATAVQILARDRLLSRGVEAELDWRPNEAIELFASASFNPTDFVGTSRPPQNRPRWRGFAELRVHPARDWTFALRALAVGSSKASAVVIGDRVVTLAGYERIDLRAAWTPLAWLEVFVEIENATNRTRREAVGFESPGIAPRLGVSISR